MFKLINLIPIKTNINFIKYKKLAFFISTIAVILSTVILFIKGLNFGIDFTGGVSIEIKPIKENITTEYLRKELKELNPDLQKIEDTGVITIKLPQKDDDKEQMKDIEKIKTILGENVEYRNLESVGPKVGKQLIKDGILATIFALLAISFYIWVRFEMHFALGALLSLAHDIIITLGLFSVLGLEFNLTTVAAILTLAGYSINDTVVSYDRMRENLRKFRKKTIKELINNSLNETITRSFLTSITTFLAVFAIFIFGGSVLKSFSFAMLFGIIIGTYSSIYIAMPMLEHFDLRE